MEGRTRRSARLAASVKQEQGVKFDQGQGLVLRQPSGFALAVVDRDVKGPTRSILVTLLVESEGPLRYRTGSSSTCTDDRIITEFNYQQDKNGYRITKKQYDRITAAVQDCEHSAEDSFSEEEKPKKRGRAKTRKAQRPTKKPNTGEPATFKKGVFNPNVPSAASIETELLSSPTASPLFGVSLSVNNKNFHRAVHTNNPALFKSLMKSKDALSSVSTFWSPDSQVTPLMLAISNDNEFFVRALIKELLDNKLQRGFEPECALRTVGTGGVSVQAFGVNVRAVNMSRGGREGNNAFLYDQTVLQDDTSSLLASDVLKTLVFRGISPPMLDLLYSLVPGVDNALGQHIGEAVRTGNVQMAKHLISWFLKRGGYGLNTLHGEVLRTANLTPFRKVSVTKKPIENYLVAPLHVACINPNTGHLQSLIEACDDIGYADVQGRRPIHYAAACTEPDPVLLLIKHGANVNECDKFKITPLMLAATYDRHKTAKVLIDSGVLNISVKSKEGMAAVHYAAVNGNVRALEILINSGAVVDQPGNESKTPLMYAACKGEFECVKLLLDSGAKVLKRDRRRRTALIFAVKNGFTTVACLLLEHGADFNDPDSSKNSPLHYAAAYGWVQCINLLIVAGANINAANDWKLQPLLVAMLKGQSDCSSRLLEEPELDVNCKDDSGRTLLSLSVEMLSEEALRQIRFLVNEKRADANVHDLQGRTPLHFLCAKERPVCYNSKFSIEEKHCWEEAAWELQIRTLESLVQGGADINRGCALGKTPVYYAMESSNLKTTKYLIENGADLTVKRTDGGGILHSITALNVEFFELFSNMLDSSAVVESCLHVMDEAGMVPFLYFVHFFAVNAGETKDQIRQSIQDKMTEELNRLREDEKMQVEEDPERENEESDMGKGRLRRRKRAAPAKTRKPTKRKIHQNLGQYFSNATLRVDYNELTRQTEEKFQRLVLEFLNLIQKMVQRGADSLATVQKIKKYREDPALIEREELGCQRAPQNLTTIYHQGEDLAPKKSEYFIVDLDGTKKWKEYTHEGQRNALHLLHSFPDPTILKFLLTLNIPVNQRDFYGRTPLSLFCASNHLNQAETLLQSGASPNIYNYTNEGPIHASLNNIRLVELLTTHNAAIDVLTKENTSPLHTAANNKDLQLLRVLLKAGANPNLPNDLFRTPLHIAFNVSDHSADASFESESLLLHHGANINAIDARNRTPLHYAFVKIGKHRDMTQIDPIEAVSSACCREEINVNMPDIWQKTPLHYAAQRGALTSTMFMLSKGAELDLPDDEGNTPLALAFKYGHANYAILLIQQGAEIESVVNVTTPKEGDKGQQRRSLFGHRRDQQVSNLPDGTYSMFRAAVIQGWQGAAYLLLSKGYDYMLAMQDAMNEQRFQLVKTLLAKVPNDSVLRQNNEFCQNLFHILATKGASANDQLTSTIAEELFDRGVDVSAVDENLRTPLHYAMEHHYFRLSCFLIGKGCSMTCSDTLGDTPLSLAVMKDNILKSEILLKLAVNNGATLNFIYTDGGIQLTPLLNAIKHKAEATMIKFFIDNGCSLSEVDSEGKNALIYAIINNDLGLLSAMLNEEALDINQLDKKGKNVVHYVVQPFDLVSYENIEMLKLLVASGALAGQADEDGHTPYYYASRQRSGRMKGALESLGIREKPQIERRLSIYQEPNVQIDYEADADEYVNQQKMLKTEIEYKRGPDHEAGDFPESYEVFEDYDLYMTKVDISYGPYSAYLFYRMQILHDRNRDLYVLSTRWGRIGEVGAHQRTSFPEQNEAVNEFKKIFKSKAGNDWERPFTRVSGKYMLMDLHQNRIEYRDFIRKLDLKAAPETSLPEVIFNSFKVVSVVAIYSKEMGTMRMDDTILNLSSISKDRIGQAEKLLLELSDLNEQLDKTKSREDIIEIKEEIYGLSSRYYELLPVKQYTSGPIPPILSKHQVQFRFQQLENLKNIEIASKIILGALKSERTMNPVDYILHSLPVNVSPLSTSDAEYTFIKDYLHSGGGADQQVISMFKINRRGEAERISLFEQIANRKLLWHGTPTSNLIGILSRGLVMPQYGGMFGRGIYLANWFSKSRGFSYTYTTSEHGEEENKEYFMLLCEVVLGKEDKKYQGNHVVKPKNGCHCVLGVGTMHPDPEYSVYMQNGNEIPVGPLIQREEPKKKDTYLCLSHDEYIVYDEGQVRIRYLLHLHDPHR